METAAVLIFVIGMIVMIILMIAFGALNYVLQALSLSRIARRRGVGQPWFAWVPGVSIWLFGSIADHYEKTVTGQDKKWRKINLIVRIACAAVTSVAVYVYLAVMFGAGIMGADPSTAMTVMLIYLAVVLIVQAPMFVIQYIVLYRIYRSCAPSAAKGLLVLSILLPATSFVLFALRNKDEGFDEEIGSELPQAEV